jgi:hypothetical protein
MQDGLPLGLLLLAKLLSMYAKVRARTALNSPSRGRAPAHQLPKLDVLFVVFVLVLRGPGDSYSDVILRLAAVGESLGGS